MEVLVDDCMIPKLKEEDHLMENFEGNDGIINSHEVDKIKIEDEKTVFNSLDSSETESAEDNKNSLETSPQKKKRKYCIQELKRRKRKYLGMKAHELHSIVLKEDFQFCQKYNLIATSAICGCGANMVLYTEKYRIDGFIWTCRKGHKNSLIVRKGSWFENCRGPLSKSLWMIYMWVHEYSYISMLHESDLPSKHIQGWCNKCRDACLPILKNKTDPIGGSDKVIEIFEAKFKDAQVSRTKKSKKDSEQWVLFATEHFSTNSLFFYVPDKKSQTLRDIFDNYVLPGTKVKSHIWNVYINVDEDSFEYLTNEKKIIFHDGNTKTDIYTFKRFRKEAEKNCPTLNYWDANEFCEFMYRKTLFFAEDAYLAFLKDISLVFSPEGGIIRKALPVPRTQKKKSA